MIKNFKVLFVISKSRINKKGLAPLVCRVTFSGKRKHFSTGLSITPKTWSSRQQRVKPPNKRAEYINSELSLIEQNLNKAFFMLKVKEDPFDVDDIYALYRGATPKAQYGVLEYFQQYLSKRKKLIGIEIAQSTWKKFYYIHNDVVAFIKFRYKKGDVLLANLDMQFLNDFEYFLKTEKKKKQITINKNLQRFKSVVMASKDDKLLDIYPFTQHRPKRVKNEVIFLTAGELRTLEEFEFVQPRLEYVRDLFIFSCYTGLPYYETMSLKPGHIQTSFDQELWIFIDRKKTSDKLSIPLLPQALRLIKKYRSENNRIFPGISNQKVNSYLKEIADIVGIEKRITHHVARKTFATTILLGNNIPIEIVSKVLGHSSIGITEKYYGKILNAAISKSFSLLLKINNAERE